MQIKTSELTGIVLDWAVAICEGYEIVSDGISLIVQKDNAWRTMRILGKAYSPSNNWQQGGEIIEREGIALRKHSGSGNWFAISSSVLGDSQRANWKKDKVGEKYGPYSYQYNMDQCRFDGTSPLVAAMRCYVAMNMGVEVEVPEDLLSVAKAKKISATKGFSR